jgi:broad specificity phosphatase PhoE
MPTPSPTASLLVVRHGQSRWNAMARWQGSADIELSDLGRSQATTAARLLGDAGHRFTAVGSSALLRASETAEIIAAHLGIGGPVIDDRWREAHAGEWQGLTPAEIRDEWPGYLERNLRPPGFEPVESVVERTMSAALDALRAAVGGSPGLVVSHSGVIRTLRRHLGAASDRVPNLGGTWLHLVDDTVWVGDVFDPQAAPPASGFSEDPGDEAPGSTVAHRSFGGAAGQ